MKRRLILGLIVTAAAGATAVGGSYAAFSRTTGDASNQFNAGSVSVTDGHAAVTPITITNLRPGTTISNCLPVTYGGSLSSSVRQYATTSGSLAPYIQLTVTRGTGLSAAWSACTGFSADATNYIGQGAGVVYSGALSSFPTTFAGATVDPTAGSPESWTNAETHAYKYDVSITNTAAAQGLSGSMTITWEAQNQ
jgi:hypothetical protein